MNHPSGAVAAGHPATAEAAETILRAGGNAVDASLAAVLTACVVEPVLASLGGGGFLLASGPSGTPCIIDFFAQTPKVKRPTDELQFTQVLADFGAAQQAFHIGLGAIATPGLIRGVFEAHAALGSVPIREIFAPSIAFARRGTEVREFDAYVMNVCSTIFQSTSACANLYASPSTPAHLLRAGDSLVLGDLADTLDSLAHEGPDLFYRGEIAARICSDMANGGHLIRGDFADYKVERRTPLEGHLGGYALRSNPPPSTGGLLLAFALEILAGVPQVRSRGVNHLRTLVWAMELTGEARIAAMAGGRLHPNRIDSDFVDRYRREILGRSRALRGTTHISVLDREGGAASLTVSNGEGAGYVAPGTGIVLNNMLGEDDINPGGFHRWHEDERMTSMMSPTIARTRRGHTICLGSGGSNRIRSALLQVLTNIAVRGMDADEAIEEPRIHFEPNPGRGGLLSIEGGFDVESLQPLLDAYPNHHIWERRNMFFGGTHAVVWDGSRTHAAGDPRRGGTAIILGD